MLGNILGCAALLQEKHVSVYTSLAAAPQEAMVFCDIIISNMAIDFPRVSEPDILMAFSQDAYKEHILGVGEDAVVFYDPLFVKPAHGACHYAVAAADAAQKELKTIADASLAFLSCVVRATRIVSLDALTKSVRVTQPPSSLLTYLKAVDLGIRVAKKVKYP